MKKARRYNRGKIRYDLIPPKFTRELAKVYTMGAEKYTIVNEDGSIDDGANNWMKGMSWKDTLAAVKRHLEKFQEGEDYDYDYPQEILEQYGPSLHLANAAWGISVLTAYYNIAPHFDDRKHYYLNPLKIGLDIDDVLADWLGSFCKITKTSIPDSWKFHRNLSGVFEQMEKDGVNIEEWMENLPTLSPPSDIPFEPIAYITSRSHVPVEIAEKWLDKNKYPAAPVIQTYGESKVKAIKEMGIQIFVDDNYDNFVEINNAGICCYLFDRPHNKRYNVGYKRIYNIKDILR